MVKWQQNRGAGRRELSHPSCGGAAETVKPAGGMLGPACSCWEMGWKEWGREGGLTLRLVWQRGMPPAGAKNKALLADGQDSRPCPSHLWARGPGGTGGLLDSGLDVGRLEEPAWVRECVVPPWLPGTPGGSRSVWRGQAEPGWEQMLVGALPDVAQTDFSGLQWLQPAGILKARCGSVWLL